MNHFVLVGRLTKDPELISRDGKSNCRICLAIKRQFKNSDGIYDTDFINCTVWNIIAEKVCEFCKKGDIISVRGRLQNNNYIDKDDKNVYSYEVIAEQVAFIHSKNAKQDNLTEVNS